MVKYGLDKRIGMVVMQLSGTKVRNVVLGILVGTAIPSAFISEASIAPMFVPIAMALYTLTSKKIGSAPQLGKLLMMYGRCANEPNRRCQKCDNDRLPF